MFKRSTPILASFNEAETVAFYTEKLGFTFCANKVLNAKYAEKRATDYLRAYCDPSFVVEPPFEDWEVKLHEPPPLKDQNNS
jgi:hypothetical protein